MQMYIKYGRSIQCVIQSKLFFNAILQWGASSSRKYNCIISDIMPNTMAINVTMTAVELRLTAYILLL